jgi:hypothetical protein
MINLSKNLPPLISGSLIGIVSIMHTLQISVQIWSTYRLEICGFNLNEFKKIY